MTNEMTYKVPEKGETVLVLDLTNDPDRKVAEEYRNLVRSSGGRIRLANCIESFQRHLQVYTPTFVVVLKNDQ